MDIILLSELKSIGDNSVAEVSLGVKVEVVPSICCTVRATPTAGVAVIIILNIDYYVRQII